MDEKELEAINYARVAMDAFDKRVRKTLYLEEGSYKLPPILDIWKPKQIPDGDQRG